jgi:hypothetical protein
VPETKVFDLGRQNVYPSMNLFVCNFFLTILAIPPTMQDMTLITGMDTSAVDIFNDIKNLCSSTQCKLFVTGLTSNFRSILSLGGFKPETTERSQRKLRFFASLDAALGKAEDLLLEAECGSMDELPTESRARLMSESDVDVGFAAALRLIDVEHGDRCSLELLGWQRYTQLVELNPGDELYNRGEEDVERGLFFVESGVLVSRVMCMEWSVQCFLALKVFVLAENRTRYVGNAWP